MDKKRYKYYVKNNTTNSNNIVYDLHLIILQLFCVKFVGEQFCFVYTIFVSLLSKPKTDVIMSLDFERHKLLF